MSDDLKQCLWFGWNFEFAKWKIIFISEACRKKTKKKHLMTGTYSCIDTTISTE